MSIPQEIFRENIIKVAVDRAHEFGYPSCTIGNIMTDQVYKMFFISILKQEISVRSGQGGFVMECLKALLMELETVQ